MRIVDVVVQYAEAYGQPLTTVGLELYVRDLASDGPEWSVEEVVQGFRSHRRTPSEGRFWPAPGDILQHMDAARRRRSREEHKKAQEAVDDAERRIYQAVVDGMPYEEAREKFGLSTGAES